MLKGIAATASLFLLFSGQIALAQSPPSVTVTSNATGQLLDGDIYAIDIVCQQQQGKELKEAIDRSWLATNTRTHAILISTAATTKKADGNDKLPDSTLTAVEVFSVDKSTTYVDHRDCEHHFLVAGGKRYFIIGTINVLDDFANSPAGTGFSNLATIVSPLFTLFTGNPLPAIIAGKLTNLQAVQNPIQNILNALNRGKNFTRIVQIVGSGTYTVKTPYSIVTIKVRPVPSVVLDGNSTFRTDFRAQINAAPEKIDVNNIDKRCQGVRSGLTESSFTSRTDIAYALIALAAKASFGRDQVIRC